ncbi:hypothetical protein C6497_05540, partial [Candidatus Poribacteria bacterium]
MSYPDEKYYITFLSQRYMDFEKSLDSTVSVGRPQKYSDCLLIIFFTIMTLKQINHFKAQYMYLQQHPDWVKRLKFKSIPHRTTLSRRYKQLSQKIQLFIEYLGDIGVDLDTESPQDIVYEDKSLYKAQG